jgi:hypothetical protein
LRNMKRLAHGAVPLHAMVPARRLSSRGLLNGGLRELKGLMPRRGR